MSTPGAVMPVLSRIAYDSGYYLAYGVVFPSAFLVHAIPGARVATSGFADGFAAARDYVHSLRQSATPEWQSVSESQIDQSVAESA